MPWEADLPSDAFPFDEVLLSEAEFAFDEEVPFEAELAFDAEFACP